jgi:hypothetical protein
LLWICDGVVTAEDAPESEIGTGVDSWQPDKKAAAETTNIKIHLIRMGMIIT